MSATPSPRGWALLLVLAGALAAVTGTTAAYVTHDHGIYARTSSLASQLLPAIEVWCQVWSRPEPRLALLGAGRRDLPFDSGLPIPLWRRSGSGEVTPLSATVTGLNDQHAFAEVEAASELAVGDLVCLPCVGCCPPAAHVAR